jgi:YgiT-type zinc finger domain-containing protein
MKCGVCGDQLRPVHSDLPFKVSEQTIVILKALPVLQCQNCAQYLLEDRVLSRVDAILASIDSAAELEIIRYAA